jgi:hypothetical protein
MKSNIYITFKDGVPARIIDLLFEEVKPYMREPITINRLFLINQMIKNKLFLLCSLGKLYKGPYSGLWVLKSGE